MNKKNLFGTFINNTIKGSDFQKNKCKVYENY